MFLTDGIEVLSELPRYNETKPEYLHYYMQIHSDNRLLIVASS